MTSIQKTPRVAVTGVNGFVGKHLARELYSSDIEVVGVGLDEIVAPEIQEVVGTYYKADLATQWPPVDNLDAVIHLAGLAAVGPSFEDPQRYINLNSSMVTNLAEYYLQQDQRPRLVIVSSGAIYDSNQPMPLAENSAVGLSSPYALSKVLVENQCAYYRNRGLDCVVARPFNHIGPGQLGGFLVPDVVEQLRQGDSLTVGNITTKRDYTDVRDIARAYRLLATTPNLSHPLYNACSGTSRSGEELVNMVKHLMGKEAVETTVDQTKVRPTDPADIYGDASRLQEDTGWKPEISLEQTLEDILAA